MKTITALIVLCLIAGCATHSEHCGYTQEGDSYCVLF